jgi:hypothetical protein
MSERRDTQGADLFWFYALLGSILSALAIISLTQKVLDVGLVPVMQEIVDYYRHTVHPIMHVMLGWVRWLFSDWVLPEWFKDLYALSFLGGFSFARGLRLTFSGQPVSPVAVIVIGFACGVFPPSGLFFLAAGLFALVRSVDNDPLFNTAFLLSGQMLALSFVETLAFFAINSQM